MTIHHGYYIEMIFMSVSSFIFFLGCISLWLTYRFTPKKKWILTKIILTSIASVAVIFQLIRGMDSHGVFGLFDVPTQHALQSMTTGTLLHGGAEILFTSTRSFYVMLNKPLTKFLRLVYFGATIINHITLLIFVIIEAATYEADDRTDQQKLYSYLVAKDVCFDVMAISVLAVSFWSLYGLRKAVTAFIATLSSQQGWVNGSTPLATSQQLNPFKGGPLQSPSHELPSSAKETDHADPGAPNSRLERQGSEEDGLPGVVDEVVASSPPPQPSPSATPAAPASAPRKPQLTIVIAPIPTAPITTISPVAVQPVGATSAAANRIAELRSAESKLNRLMMSICFILLLGIASSIPHFIVYGTGREAENLDDYVITDPSKYPVSVILLPIVQSTVIAIMIWYAWVSPSVWWSSSLPFWPTLIYGLPDEITSPPVAPASGAKYQHARTASLVFPRAPSNSIVGPQQPPQPLSTPQHQTHERGGSTSLSNVTTGQDVSSQPPPRRVISQRRLTMITLQPSPQKLPPLQPPHQPPSSLPFELQPSSSPEPHSPPPQPFSPSDGAPSPSSSPNASPSPPPAPAAAVVDLPGAIPTTEGESQPLPTAHSVTQEEPLQLPPISSS